MTHQTQPALAEPALRATAAFSDLGTVVTHASDVPHHYAKDSPWNADETLAMVSNGDILDGQTFAPTGINVQSGPVSANEHRAWSNTDRRYVYGAHYQNRQWVRMDATNPANNVVLATYTQYSTVSFGEYEGTIDDNDTGVVLVGNGTIPFLIDPRTGAVRCTVSGGGGFGGTVSDTGISQDGRWMLVNWDGHGVDAYDASSCSFARNLTSWTSHYDACVSAAGEQVIVQAPYPLYMVRISDGVKTVVYGGDTTYPVHISCRNTKRPGWAYVSMFNDTCGSTEQSAKIFERIWALKLDGTQAVENFAWEHNGCPNSGYGDEPMASPSPSGTRVWWKTNWDGTSSGTHSFVVQK